MSSTETLPKDFCSNPDNAWTFPKVFYTFYSTFITLFHQFPHNQYKPKVFLITIRTCDHDSPHTGSLYILPMYYLYAK